MSTGAFLSIVLGPLSTGWSIVTGFFADGTVQTLLGIGAASVFIGIVISFIYKARSVR